MKRLIVLVLGLGCCFHLLHAQLELASFGLEPQLIKANELLCYQDDEGRALLTFGNAYMAQYALFESDMLIKSSTHKWKTRRDFTDAVLDQQHLRLFYQDPRDKNVWVFETDMKEFPTEMQASNIDADGLKYLTDAFLPGEYMFVYAQRKPFSLHTYSYVEGNTFQLQSQAFPKSKNEIYLGKIETEQELVIAKATLNPFTFHFYRYIQGEGFVKKSVEIRPLYDQVGVNGRNVFYTTEPYNIGPLLPLAAHIEGDEIYLEMEYLTHINSFRQGTNRPYAGVLHFDWNSELGEILIFDQPDDFRFANRSVTLNQSRYYKFLVNKDSFQLEVFDVRNQQLLKTITYNQDQEVDLIHGQGQVYKQHLLYLQPVEGAFVEFNLEDKLEKIDSKTLFKSLSKEVMYIDVISDDDLIELRITGTNMKGIFFARSETISFVGYLSNPDLQIVNDIRQDQDPRWSKIEDYLNRLAEKKALGAYVFFTKGERIYLAYLDPQAESCRIIAF